MEEYIRRMVREEIRNTLMHMFTDADSMYTDCVVHDRVDTAYYEILEILGAEIQRLT